MATNTVTVKGMFGSVDGKIHTYFANSPVIIEISGLYWGAPVTSPFTVVRVEVWYNGVMVGNFRADTGGQTEITFDISSALRAIWSGYDFSHELEQANAALSGVESHSYEREMRGYILRIYTEYISSNDSGAYTTTQCTVQDEDGNVYTDIPGANCLMGGWTEWERSQMEDVAYADVSALEHHGVRHGDASTKPIRSPERVGKNSITSWVDVGEEVRDGVNVGYTKTIFYPAPVGTTLPAATGEPDDIAGRQQGWGGHAPLVLRDSQPYIDFIFVNRRGAVETCSALMKESMDVNVDTTAYSIEENPAFIPSRRIGAVGDDGQRSWQMSSGYVTREWAEWWAMEFLGGKQKHWWMLYKGSYVPVSVTPAKRQIPIYDRSKQQLQSVDFTVTLGLKG